MFTVIELQNGVVGSNVWVYDSIEQAYSKYYSTLSVAATSSVPVHAAVILNKYGEMIDSKYFEHGVMSE